MQSHRRFVAHIDILGMRAMVSRDPELAWKKLSSLANVREHLGKIQLTHVSSGHQYMLAEHIFSVMFSDTIVLFTKTESDDDLQAILIATSEVLHKAMCQLTPVRIGVAGGQFFYNIEESLYMGPALIEAYQIGEAAQWLGIVTTKDIYQQSLNAKAKFQSGTSDIVIPAHIPIKNGLRSGYAINWVAPFRHDFKVKPPITTDLFYSQFEDAFGPLSELEEDQLMKYVNTTNFINEHFKKT